MRNERGVRWQDVWPAIKFILLFYACKTLLAVIERLSIWHQLTVLSTGTFILITTLHVFARHKCPPVDRIPIARLVLQAAVFSAIVGSLLYAAGRLL